MFYSNFIGDIRGGGGGVTSFNAEIKVNGYNDNIDDFIKVTLPYKATSGSSFNVVVGTHQFNYSHNGTRWSIDGVDAVVSQSDTEIIVKVTSVLGGWGDESIVVNVLNYNQPAYSVTGSGSNGDFIEALETLTFDSISANSINELLVGWVDVQGDTYHIERSLLSDFSTIDTNYNTHNTEYVLPIPATNTVYHYRGRAEYGGSYSDYGNTASAIYVDYGGVVFTAYVQVGTVDFNLNNILEIEASGGGNFITSGTKYKFVKNGVYVNWSNLNVNAYTFWAQAVQPAHTKGIECTIKIENGVLSLRAIRAKYTDIIDPLFNFDTGGNNSTLVNSLSGSGYAIHNIKILLGNIL